METFEQTNHSTQDIEISLRFSSERRFMP